MLPICVAGRGAPACVQECGYEDEPVLDAALLVRPALLSGPEFNVDPKVPVGGFMARFSISTKYGPLQAESAQLLAIRVAEIPAIDILEQASHSGAFGHALAERGKKTGNAIVKVVTHPIDSITGLPMGVVRYFKKQIDLWAGRAQSASDQSSRRFENKGDPFRAPDGPMTAGRDVPFVPVALQAAAPADIDTPPDVENDPDAAPDNHQTSDGQPATPKKNRAWYARVGSEVSREAKRYLKYNQARNEMAKYLGIDSNTSNPYVTERLDSLAWAAVGGNFSAGEALGDIAGTAAEIITDSSLINEFVLTHTPEEIRAKNEHSLLTVCSDEFGVRQFLRRGGFNDTLRTQLTESLRKLKPVAGCNELLELGATTRGEVEARYLVNALALIVKHATDASGGRLLIVGASIAYVTPDKKQITKGTLILPLPVDYLSWSADIDAFFASSEFARSDKMILIGGEASPLAQKNLTARGWSLVLRAPYPGAPDYVKGDFARAAER